MENPIGMDDVPFFSFQLLADNSGETLATYEIIVKNAEKVVWDSGQIESDHQLFIKYQGEPLKAETRYTWNVYAWNHCGEKSVSSTAVFEMGRMKPQGWEDAKWITSEPLEIFIGGVFKGGPETTAPYMRKEFEVVKPIEEATLYISGVGYYECWVNGVSVKDTVLDPAFTEYDKAVMYQTYKISNIRQGLNAIAISVGDGFYNVDLGDTWNFTNALWRDHAKCICVLKLKYRDGSEEKIVSDRSFKGSKGPILVNNVRGMEKYDATKELGAWTMPGYDDSTWNSVKITKAPGGELIGQYSTPIRIVREFDPVCVDKISDTIWVVDAGENTSGWAEISMTAPEGTTIMLRYSEEFDEELNDKRKMWTSLRPGDYELFQTDQYIAAGKEKERWHPVYHYYGFRYVLIKCETGIPQDLSIKIQEVRTDFKQAGDFKCSDEILNKIHEITCRSTRTNFHGMPTDCPHREKNGWTGDAQLTAEELLLNFDCGAAYNRWMDDIIRAQRKSGQLPGIVPSTGWGYNWGSGPAWDSVCAVIPYNMYLYNGDSRVVEKMYPCLKRYIAFCDTMSDDGICEFGLWDWNAPKDEWHKQCETAVTDTAYYYYDIVIASKMAQILGLEEEEEFYANKATDVREKFRKYFIQKAEDELELIHCTKGQTCLASMLYFGLVNEDEKELFVRELIEDIHSLDNHFDVGAFGMKYVCNVLLEAGETELLVKTITNLTYPSYANLINRGATTLWEDFEGSVSSHNHHYYGDISACFYKALAGINPDENMPGFKNTIFKPQFVSTLDHVSAWHMSPYGKVASEWKREGNNVHLTLSVPANTTGELWLTGGNKMENTEATYVKFNAGVHEFIVEV